MSPGCGGAARPGMRSRRGPRPGRRCPASTRSGWTTRCRPRAIATGAKAATAAQGRSATTQRAHVPPACAAQARTGASSTTRSDRHDGEAQREPVRVGEVAPRIRRVVVVPADGLTAPGQPQPAELAEAGGDGPVQRLDIGRQQEHQRGQGEDQSDGDLPAGSGCCGRSIVGWIVMASTDMGESPPPLTWKGSRSRPARRPRRSRSARGRSRARRAASPASPRSGRRSRRTGARRPATSR